MQDTNPLTPLEMVEHLKRGFGSDGQVLPCCFYSLWHCASPLLTTAYIPFSFLMGELLRESVLLLCCQRKLKSSFTSVGMCFNCEWLQNGYYMTQVLLLEASKGCPPLFLFLLQVVHVEKISARNATYVEIPSSLSESTMLALKNVGVTRLYSHQVRYWYI